MKCVSVWTHSAFTTCMMGYLFFSGFFFWCFVSLWTLIIWNEGQVETVSSEKQPFQRLLPVCVCVSVCMCVYLEYWVFLMHRAPSPLSPLFFFSSSWISMQSRWARKAAQLLSRCTNMKWEKKKKNTAHWQEPKQQAPVSVRAIVPAQVFSSLFFFAVMFQSQEPSHVPLMEHFTEPFQHAPSWNWRSVSIIRLFFIDTVGYNAAYTHTHWSYQIVATSLCKLHG